MVSSVNRVRAGEIAAIRGASSCAWVILPAGMLFVKVLLDLLLRGGYSALGLEGERRMRQRTPCSCIFASSEPAATPERS